MADPALSAGQYSIGKPGDSSALIFGAGTSVLVASTQTDTGSLNVQDQAVTGHDGTLFGVDTLPGMIVTQTGQAMASTGAAAMDAYSALSGAWNDPAVRLASGTVQVLRARYPGSGVTRRCYGRGRKIMPTYGWVTQGVVQFTSQFQAADNTWYDDTAVSIE